MELLEQRALETQMNADVAQMNVPHRRWHVRACVQRSRTTLTGLPYVYLRYICVHLRLRF